MAASITCPRCGMTSHNPNDVREGYCGNCHAWTGRPTTDEGATMTEPTITDRGFKHYEKIPSELGGSIQLAESSAASGPHVWLWTVVPDEFEVPDGDTTGGALHLTLENAAKLCDQLTHVIDNHYQLG